MVKYGQLPLFKHDVGFGGLRYSEFNHIYGNESNEHGIILYFHRKIQDGVLLTGDEL